MCLFSTNAVSDIDLEFCRCDILICRAIEFFFSNKFHVKAWNATVEGNISRFCQFRKALLYIVLKVIGPVMITTLTL